MACCCVSTKWRVWDHLPVKINVLAGHPTLLCGSDCISLWSIDSLVLAIPIGLVVVRCSSFEGIILAAVPCSSVSHINVLSMSADEPGSTFVELIIVNIASVAF